MLWGVFQPLDFARLRSFILRRHQRVFWPRSLCWAAVTSGPLSLSSLPRDTECVPGGRAGGLQGTESTEQTPECKKPSKGKSGQTQARPEEEENAGSRCTFLSALNRGLQPGSQVLCRWSQVTLLGSRGFAATCLGQASPVAFAFRLAPKLASRRIVFILFLQPQLLPDSFQGVTPQLSESKLRQPILAPSLQPSFRNSLCLGHGHVPDLGAKLWFGCCARALCNLIVTACSSLLSLPAPRASAPRRQVLEFFVTCQEHSGQTKEVSWNCKSSCPRGSELAPSHFYLFF